MVWFASAWATTQAVTLDSGLLQCRCECMHSSWFGSKVESCTSKVLQLETSMQFQCHQDQSLLSFELLLARG